MLCTQSFFLLNKKKPRVISIYPTQYNSYCDGAADFLVKKQSISAKELSGAGSVHSQCQRVISSGSDGWRAGINDYTFHKFS